MSYDVEQNNIDVNYLTILLKDLHFWGLEFYNQVGRTLEFSEFVSQS